MAIKRRKVSWALGCWAAESLGALRVCVHPVRQGRVIDFWPSALERAGEWGTYKNALTFNWELGALELDLLLLLLLLRHPDSPGCRTLAEVVTPGLQRSQGPPTSTLQSDLHTGSSLASARACSRTHAWIWGVFFLSFPFFFFPRSPKSGVGREAVPIKTKISCFNGLLN